MIELQTSVKQDDTTRTRTPKPGYLNLSNANFITRTRPLIASGASILRMGSIF